MALKIAQDFNEVVALGREIAAKRQRIYSQNTLNNMMDRINFHMPDAPEERKQEILYAAVYDWNAYGATINEEFAYRFFEKSHTEKVEYLVAGLRSKYVDYLNGGRNFDTIYQLEDKFRLYQRLAPYYKREVIQITGEDDYPMFEEFIHRHPSFVAKPSNNSCGIGVHRVDLSDYQSVEDVFHSLLREGENLSKKHPTRGVEMVLEELIDQDETMAELHPQSVNALRITTVRAADGNIVMYRPRIKIGMNGGFLASAAENGVIAEIDPESGNLRTDGFNENGGFFVVHPNSGIKIKGFQIPKWDELLDLVDHLNKEMHEYGYIGWDLVLSKSGWCVMEGNYNGEIASQVILGKGLRRELEELIGWKPEKEYWELYE